MESNSRDVEREASFIIALGESAMVVDRAGVVIDANGKQAELLGLTVKEMRGASIWDILPADAAGQERPLLEEVICSGKPVTFMDKLGDRWFESSIHPFLDSEGNVEKLAIFRTDVTDRRRTGVELEAYRAELERMVERRTQKLRDLNKALQTISECNKILFRASDEMTLLKRICRAIVEIQGSRMAWVGYSEDRGLTVQPMAQAGLEEGYIELVRISQDSGNEGEPTGTAIRTGLPCVVDDLRKGPMQATWRREAARRGYSSTISIPLSADGGVFGALNIFSNYAGAFDDEQVRLLSGLADNLVFGINTIRAGAEHRQAEEALARSETRYRELVANLSEAVVEIGMDSIITYASPQVERIFGFRAEEIVGKSLVDFIHPDFLEKGLEAISRIAEEGPVMDFEFKTMHKDGRYLDASISGQLVEEAGATKIVGIVKDITERKQAEERVKAALREKEVLLKEVHHRVKNNLQVIISLLGLQSRQVRDKAVLTAFRDCQSRIQSIALIHEKLYKSKDLARVDFAGYIRNLVPDLLRTYGLEPGSISLDIKAEDVRLGIDTAVPCGLIINELITNSLKHAFPGGRKGSIAIDFRSEGAGWIMLSVADDGVGLPESIDINRVETMGLKMISNLTKQLDGSIEMERKGGTKFRVKFNAEPREL
jgi:PAS domain S-box-containing protein